jgi:hypothetical protein
MTVLQRTQEKSPALSVCPFWEGIINAYDATKDPQLSKQSRFDGVESFF